MFEYGEAGHYNEIKKIHITRRTSIIFTSYIRIFTAEFLMDSSVSVYK